jgi:hypothetical protein|tara:strand:+ start:64 stop:477 length:414 start_codon:yes stop_codon:yes gene_type:complete
MANWIFVETLHNWEVDQRNNFEFMGIKENKFKLRNIMYGDKIFVYISKIMKFSDVRQIVDNKLHIKPSGYNYDKEFKKSIKTKMIKLLDKSDWLDFSIISKELEIFAKSTSPANKLLNSPINLENHDYEILKNHFKI